MSDDIDLDAIRRRHQVADDGIRNRTWCVLPPEVGHAWGHAHADRAALLTIVDRLAEELAESRAAYDAVSRLIGASLRRPMQHGADPKPLTLDGGAA